LENSHSGKKGGMLRKANLQEERERGRHPYFIHLMGKTLATRRKAQDHHLSQKGRAGLPEIGKGRRKGRKDEVGERRSKLSARRLAVQPDPLFQKKLAAAKGCGTRSRKTLLEEDSVKGETAF